MPKKLKKFISFILAGIGFVLLLSWGTSSPSWKKLAAATVAQGFSGEYYMGFLWSWHLSIKTDQTFSIEIFTDMGTHYKYTGNVAVEGIRFRLIPSNTNDYNPRELVPIIWGQRKYIIDASMVSDFCNDIKQGREPRDDVTGGPYYLRDGDWDRFTIWKPIQLDGHLLCP